MAAARGDMPQHTAIVVGVGAELGLGAALCRKFAAQGLHVIVAGRTASRLERVTATITRDGGSAQPIVVDVTCERDVAELFVQAAAPAGGHLPATLVVFNAGNNEHIPFLDLSPARFEEFWRVGCLGGFLVGQAAVSHLLAHDKGTLLFTGASASLRGKAGFAHFAAAKAGLRMISQSLAREFGPLGLHVAHVIIDGAIHGDRLLSRRPQAAQQLGADGMLDIEAIAEVYWQLHRQSRSAWTQEMDLRPYKEDF